MISASWTPNGPKVILSGSDGLSNLSSSYSLFKTGFEMQYDELNNVTFVTIKVVGVFL